MLGPNAPSAEIPTSRNTEVEFGGNDKYEESKV